MKLNFLTRWLDLNLFEEIGSSIPPMRAWIVHNIIKISLEGSLLCINFQNHLLGKVYTTISITIEMEEIRELAASDRKAGTGSLYQTTLPRWQPLPLSRPRSHDYYSRTTPEISYSTYPPNSTTPTLQFLPSKKRSKHPTCSLPFLPFPTKLTTRPSSSAEIGERMKGETARRATHSIIPTLEADPLNH